MTCRVVSVNTSDGGVPKLRSESRAVRFAGVEGDRQRDLRIHGGPDRAVCLYALELILALRAEGHPIDVGFIGENLTLSGVDWALMVPGQRLAIAQVILEVTRYTSPCSNIAPYFLEGRFSRVSQKLHPGWSRVYAKVVREGTICIGDPVVFEQQGSAPERHQD
jgi:MOSC domain-containing protein YiiM